MERPCPIKTNKPMTDKDYIEYAKAIHEEVYVYGHLERAAMGM